MQTLKPLGTTALNAYPAPHDQTLLEQIGAPAKSTATAYCRWIDRFLKGKIDVKTVLAKLPVRG